MNRRAFLRAGAGGLLAGSVLAGSPFGALTAFAESVEGDGYDANASVGYGPLRVAGADLELPDGFSYVRFAGEGTTMSNGKRTPPYPDGMAAFAGATGFVLLVRNHELEGLGSAFGGNAYDDRARGGTTTVVFNTGTGRAVAVHPTLTGTVSNCAGGKTPWGSWITCEETDVGLRNGYHRPHGYCFEVPASASSPVAPNPLRGLGRFHHEAVCVNPGTGAVFLTEDQGSAGFYRFTPKVPGNLAAGGKLQMLAVDGRPRYDTRRGAVRGRRLPVTWVDIPDPDPANAGEDPLAVYWQGHQRGGAIFNRLEGCTWHKGAVVLVSTAGGSAGLGQIWEYRPGSSGGGELTLLFESPGPSVLQNPDNVTPTPAGGLLLCEDSEGSDLLRGLTPGGQLFNFARNRASDGEFCGACFSPDGKILFVNIQRPNGATYAITGPWSRGPL